MEALAGAQTGIPAELCRSLALAAVARSCHVPPASELVVAKVSEEVLEHTLKIEIKLGFFLLLRFHFVI